MPVISFGLLSALTIYEYRNAPRAKSATNAKEHHKHRNETTQCNCCQRCLKMSRLSMFCLFSLCCFSPLIWWNFLLCSDKTSFFGGSGMRDSDVIEWKGTKPGTTTFVLTNTASSTICSGLFMMPMTSLRVWAKKLTIGVQSLINLMSWLLYI